MTVDIQHHLKQYLGQLLDLRGQDLFLKAGARPRVRAAGVLEVLDTEPVKEAQVKAITEYLLNPMQRDLLEKNQSVDFAFSLPGTPQRFRGNVFLQQGAYSIVIRRLWKTVPTFEELHIPAVLKKSALERSGIILLAGTVGSGKTTTVNAMIDLINQECKRHIITVEDPVEYIHEDKKSLINQREIGRDADSFSHALKYVVRQSPDVIVIGEMRDMESFMFALTASEVGRLVISTIHAKSVNQIFDRILNFFPQESRETVLNHLSFHIVCFAVERLLVTKDGKTLVPAFEVLMGNSVIRNLVREQDFEKIPQALRNGHQEGMQTMDQALFRLWKDGSISTEEALAASERPHDLEQNMKGIRIDSHTTRILGA